MSRVSTIKMTARQFLELGEDPPGVRLELVDGEIAVSPSPAPDHGYALFRLGLLLTQHVEEHDLGQVFPDTDTIFGEHEVRRPDILYFSKRRLHLVGEKAMEGPPDLAVEVLSPGSERVDRRDKFKLYAAGKVKHYWILATKQKTIEAYVLRGGKYVGGVRGSASDIVKLAPFPKLEIPLAKLWRPK
ncbi:MAG TPA: Uma2 family endonuclease [Tepidisphaeraceae bacterium]|jgi:Uma2 family endonuclease